MQMIEELARLVVYVLFGTDTELAQQEILVVHDWKRLLT